MVAPDFFNFKDGEDQPAVLVDEIPEWQEQLAQRAMRSCPEQAITIEE